MVFFLFVWGVGALCGAGGGFDFVVVVVVFWRTADFYGEIGDADARAGRAPQRHEAAPVPAVSQVVLVEPPAGAAHPRPHRREALPLLLLRPPLQAAQPRPAAHATPHRSVQPSFLSFFSTSNLGLTLAVTFFHLVLPSFT